MTKINQSFGQTNSKEFLDHFDSFAARRVGCPGSRFNSQARNLEFLDELEKVTIVAGDFDHFALAGKTESFDHSGNVGFGVSQPLSRERAKVRILIVE